MLLPVKHLMTDCDADNCANVIPKSQKTASEPWIIFDIFW